jgi:hypothetical protein
MSRVTFVVIISFLIFPYASVAETIDVRIKGVDDGIKNSIQQDYKQAVLFAKREAIERAGVKVKSKTVIKDYVLYEDYIESQAEAVLLPGYQIMDMGYSSEGVYQVVLIGKVRFKNHAEEQAVHDRDSGKDHKISIPTWKITLEGGRQSAGLKFGHSGNFTGKGWKGSAPGCGEYDILITNGSILNESIAFNIHAEYCNGRGIIEGECSGRLNTDFPGADSGKGICSGKISDPLGVRDFNFPWNSKKVFSNLSKD